jgi:hypothetical protein
MSVTLVDKMRLFRAIMADPSLPALAKNVGAVLVVHFHNWRTGRCNPSYEQLGEACGVKKRATILAVQDLEAAAWVKVERRGHRRPNVFHLAFSRAAEVHADAPQDVDPGVHGHAPQDGSEVHDHAPQSVSEVHGSVIMGAQACTLTKKNNPPASPVGGDVPSHGPRGPGFVEFWRAFPKRTRHGDAKAAFETVVASGKISAVDLVAAAGRYAAERAGQETRFAKNPVDWLNGEHWLDEPERPRPPAAAANGGRAAPFSFMDYARQTQGRSRS